MDRVVSSTLRAESFDGVAALYERARPGYPPELFDAIVARAALAPSARLLEIGAGTGKATRSFAERGFEIVALEPGAHLLGLGRAELRRFARVSWTASSFEAWEPEERAFDLVYAAQSFHWVSPEMRLARARACLRDGGWLAIFGNAPSLRGSAAREAIAEAYRRFAPSLAGRNEARTAYISHQSPLLAELRASTDFADVRAEQFDWEASYTREAYCDLLRTYSDHRALGPPHLDALLSAVENAIDALGGAIRVSYTAGLFLARGA